MIALLFQDLRYAARTFAKKPAFALSAILILAVGIGATTTIFSVVDVVLLRSLPYPEPGRIVLFTQGAHSFPDYNEWTVRLDAFSAIAGVWDERVDLTGDGPPEQVAAARVTPDFFSIFAATPHLGRFFTEEEFADDPTVAVVGHGIWQRRWGADPSLVGKTVTIDGQPLVAVGIVGRLYLSLGNFVKALDHMERYLARARKIGNSELAAAGLAELGNMRALLGQYDEALKYQSAALEERRTTEICAAPQRQ